MKRRCLTEVRHRVVACAARGVRLVDTGRTPRCPSRGPLRRRSRRLQGSAPARSAGIKPQDSAPAESCLAGKSKRRCLTEVRHRVVACAARGVRLQVGHRGWQRGSATAKRAPSGICPARRAGIKPQDSAPAESCLANKLQSSHRSSRMIGVAEPSFARPSTSTSGPPIMKSVCTLETLTPRSSSSSGATPSAPSTAIGKPLP